MKLRYLPAFGLLVLCGCGSTVQYDIPTLDKGVGGYEGKVSAFTVPYKLRYEPGPETVQRLTKVWDVGGKKELTTVVLHSKIVAREERRNWRIKIEEIQFEGRTLRSESPPLVVVRTRGTPRHPAEKVYLSFPYFSMNEIATPEPGSEQYREWSDLIRDQSFVLPDASVAMNSDLVPSSLFLNIMLDSDELSADERNQIRESIWRNTLSSRVVGETYDNGTHCLVAILDGSMAGQIRSVDFDLGLSGHWLINTKTGMSHRYAILMDVSLKNPSGPGEIAYYAELVPDEALGR